jgi:hypothetical protein
MFLYNINGIHTNHMLKQRIIFLLAILLVVIVAILLYYYGRMEAEAVRMQLEH